MKNKELVIAAIVGFLMIIFCLSIVAIKEAKKDQVIDLTAYKHVEKEDGTGYYVECNLTTEDQITINSELKKVKKLTDEDRTTGSIEGQYKIIVGDKYYAFDNSEDNKIFTSESKMYTFSSSLYETVINRCQ